MNRSLNLRMQLHMIIGAIFLVTMALAVFVCRQAVHVFYRDFVLVEKGAALGRALAGPATKSLANHRIQELQSYLNSLANDASIVEARFEVLINEIYVTDSQGNIVASAGSRVQAGFHRDKNNSIDQFAASVLKKLDKKSMTVAPESSRQGRAILDFGVPLDKDNKRLGVLCLSLSLERAQQLYWRSTLFLTLALSIVLGIIWLTLSVTLRGRIFEPVRQLGVAIQRICEGDLTIQLRIERHDELGALAESLNTLVERLKTQKLLQSQITEARSLVSSHEALAQAHKELAEAHSKLKEAQEQMVKNAKHASLGRLVRGVAHEINNPLNTVKNSLAPLQKALKNLQQRMAGKNESTTFDTESLEDLEDIGASCTIIERGVGRAVAIVRDLRSFSSLGIQELKPVDVGAVIDNAVYACEQELGPDGRVRVNVKVEPNDDGPIILEGHQNLLVQLFVNLITNAAQAIPNEGFMTVDARQYYDPKRGSQRLLIHIEDDGPGIPENVRNKIFEPFFTTKEAGQGSGLGLALCLGIVEKHDGEINVTSEEGKGSIFTIDLAISQTTRQSRTSGAFSPPDQASTTTQTAVLETQ